MRTPRRLAALLAAGTLALSGCSFSIGGPDAVEVAELEKQVAGLYTPDDPEAEITAECDGELAAELGATQDCHLDVGEQSADVRVAVTELDGDTVNFESTVFVPAERVAETVQQSLADQGFEVESVECDGELIGEPDATMSCTAAPAEGDGAIEVTVTEVDGLLVSFDFEVVS